MTNNLLMADDFTVTNLPFVKPLKSDKQHMQNTAGEVRVNS